MAGDSDSDDSFDDGEHEEFYDDDHSEGEELRDDPSDDDDSEAMQSCGDLCDDDDDEDGEGEESCDDRDGDEEDGAGEELRDDEEDCEDLCDEPSGDDDESEGEELCGVPSDDGGGPRAGEGFCVSGFSVPAGFESDLSDSLEDRSASASASEEEAPGLDEGGEGRLMPSGSDRAPPPVTGAFRMVVGFDDTDSDDYSDVGDVEFPSLPASRAAVDGLPEATLSEKEASYGCPVCKDVFASGHRVVWLPCKHYFHGECIRPWLAIRSTCPVCRYQLPTDDAESGQRQARELTVLVPVAHQGAPPQSGGGGRG